MTLLRPRTLILSPFAGDTHRNIQYAKDCLLDSIARGEAPFASHLLYTQVLYDNVPEERAKGFECETAWAMVAQQMVAYIDLGWSKGMEETWFSAAPSIRLLERRWLGGVWAEPTNA